MSAPSNARRVATSTLRKPWCSKPVVAGVPDRVVQAGRALERRLAVERGVDPAGEPWAAGNRSASSPPVRNFSRSSAAATSSAAASHAVGGADVRQLDVHRHVVVEEPVGAGRVDGGDHPPGVAGEVVEVAQRDLEPGDASPSFAASRRAPAIWPAPPVTTTESGAWLPRSAGRSVSRDDEGRRPGRRHGVRPAGHVRRDRVGEGGVARGEDRGVVDQADAASGSSCVRHAATLTMTHIPDASVRLSELDKSTSGTDGSLPTGRRGPAEAAHPAPRPRRQAVLRGADGRGGLLLGLLAALPPRRAVGDRRQSRSGSCPTRPARPTTRSSRGTSSCTTSRTDRGRRSTGRRLVLGNNDVRISYVVTGTDAVAALPQRDRRRVRLRRVRQPATVETVFGVLTYRAGDYVIVPAGDHPPLGAGRAEPALRDRGQQPHRAAEALPVALRAAARARAVLRARPVRPDRAVHLVDGDRRRGAGQAPRRRGGSSAPG